LNQNSQC